MTGSFTWKQAREDVAALYESLVGARDSANEAVLSPSREVPVGAEYREAFCDLRWEVEAAATRAERLLEMLAESSEPERPDRLAVALAAIVALGHFYVIHGRGYVGREEVEIESRLVGTDGFRGDSHAELLAWKADVEDGEVRGLDLATAAEARLEQIRELREQQRAAVVALVETLSYRPKPRFVVERRPGGEGVMYWMVIDTAGVMSHRLSYVEQLARADADRLNREEPTPAEVDAFETPISAGPEEVDTEHEAHLVVTETRWNVWSKHPDEGWEQINSNLNGKQAHAAVERLTRLDLVGVVFVALPIGQVPGGPPVTASDALVFLNPDSEVQPITGPTDAEEAEHVR